MCDNITSSNGISGATLAGKEDSHGQQTVDHLTELHLEDSSNDNDRINGVTVTAIEALQQRRLAISAKSARQLHKKTQKRKCRKKKLECDTESETPTVPKDVIVGEKWEEVRKLLNVNSHLSGPIGHGIREPKSGMECKINEEIAAGNIEEAEALSDQLATSEFSVRAAKAFAAKRFLDEKEEARKKQLAKAKTKLHWGFEAKQRWEMKGNM